MKKEVVFFTGWGASQNVWKSIIPAIDNRYQINCHIPSWLNNTNMQASLQNFDDYIDELATDIKTASNIVAWSMGGLFAISLSNRYPQLVNSICFISSVPSFVNKYNGIAGIDNDWFHSFYQHYKNDPIKTLKKFLTLQVQGDQFAKSLLRELSAMSKFDNYDLDECLYGLDLLAKINLTQELTALSCDKTFIHGKLDAVVDVAAVKYFAELCHAPLYLIESAGHIPHLSHSDQVIHILNRELFAEA